MPSGYLGDLLLTDWAEGSGSLEQDGPFSIVAMEEEEQIRLMHQRRPGKRERPADKTSQTLAQRSIPAFHISVLSCLFFHREGLLLRDHCHVCRPEAGSAMSLTIG
jgi:hypothetical protein